MCPAGAYFDQLKILEKSHRAEKTGLRTELLENSTDQTLTNDITI